MRGEKVSVRVTYPIETGCGCARRVRRLPLLAQRSALAACSACGAPLPDVRLDIVDVAREYSVPSELDSPGGVGLSL